MKSEGVGMDILMQEALEKHKGVEKENIFIVDTGKEAYEVAGKLKDSIIYKEDLKKRLKEEESEKARKAWEEMVSYMKESNEEHLMRCSMKKDKSLNINPIANEPKSRSVTRRRKIQPISRGGIYEQCVRA